MEKTTYLHQVSYVVRYEGNYLTDSVNGFEVVEDIFKAASFSTLRSVLQWVTEIQLDDYQIVELTELLEGRIIYE